MYLKLIINNWKSQPSKFLLMFSALSLGLILMTLLSGLNAGLKSFFLNEGQQEKILRELSVQPTGTKLELNLANLLPKPKLTPETVEKIKAIPEVEEVLPTNTVSGISSVQIGILGQWFQTDALLYGAPYQLLELPTESNYGEKDWQSLDEPYPAVVSSKLIDLYNFSFANANNLPQITEENFLGTEVIILLNESTFFATQSAEVVKLRAKIIGFSPNVKLIGLTLPEAVINRLNQKYLQQNNQYYLDAVVHVHSPEQLSLVQRKLQEMGLQVKTAEQSLKTLESIFQVTDLSLNFFFLIMMIMAGLLISSTFLAKIAERGKEIAILKTLGFTGNRVGLLYLTEASLVGFFSSIFGVTVGLLLAIPLNAILSNSIKILLNKPENFFVFTPTLILSLIIFSVVISCLFAYLPAKKAAKLDPVKLLTK
jgi:putative ABC transport system permease protein